MTEPADHPAGDVRLWLGDYRSRRQARRSRTFRYCSGCTYPGSTRQPIAPGEVYIRHVLFPGNDIFDNTAPSAMDECADCARRYGRGAEIDAREARR